MKIDEKASLRCFFKTARKNLPQNRRRWARESLKAMIKYNFSFWGMILSYSSFNNELETNQLNEFLISKRSLALPKVTNGRIEIFRVTCLKTQLKIAPFGMMEPNEELCEKIEAEKIQLALVPGLGFDASYHRIGYGKGHYDRLLANLKCPTLGVGYLEQYFSERFPTNRYDIKLDFLCLF